MNRFVVLFEKSNAGYGAYAPDLPGCVATGRTVAEARQRIGKGHGNASRGDAARRGSDTEPSHFELLETA